MNNAKLHGIVEYIKASGHFPFDVEDVDENLPEVLTFFGLFEVLTNEENAVLKEDLTKLALREEEVEAVRLALQTGLITEEDLLSGSEQHDEDDE
jgi:hypothetical protein